METGLLHQVLSLDNVVNLSSTALLALSSDRSLAHLVYLKDKVRLTPSEKSLTYDLTISAFA